VGGLNAHLKLTKFSQEIRVLHAAAVDESFHARFSAVGREYVYRLYCWPPHLAESPFHGWPGHGHATPFFESPRAWCLNSDEALDVAAMQEAGRHFVGEHDFTSFRAADCVAHSPVKEVTSLRVDTVECAGPAFGHLAFPGTPMVTITIRARSFLHRMVRNIAGALVAVGKGTVAPGKVPGIIKARDRSRAPSAAPAHGLYLTKVFYREQDLRGI